MKRDRPGLMPSPAKRATLAPPSPLCSPCSGVPDDLTARLRNLGARIRKQVTEGYATSPTPSPNPSPTKSPLIFQSAKDTLRDVYHSHPPTPTPSPRKRSRSDSDNNDDPNLDSDMEVDDELPSFTSKAQPSRPIKPLRKSKSSASRGPDAQQ